MSDDSQIEIPASFIAVYMPPGQRRPSLPRHALSQRHEFCDDLANMLTDTASTKLWELGVTQEDVLERIHLGLLVEGAPVSAAEAQWVIRRLAELLGWHAPPFNE